MSEAVATVPSKPPSLFRRRDFALLWAGQTASMFGTQITFVALPLTAVLLLHITPIQAGVLGALETLPFLLFGLFVGVFLDRRARRPVMIIADVVRAAALGWIPLAHVLGVLNIGQLFAVVFVVGMMTVFFDLAYQSYLPGLVGRDRLTEANGKLQLSASAADVAGPGLSGLLVSAFGAPLSLVVDAASYVLSFVTVAKLPADERPQPQHGTRAASIRASIREGFAVIGRHPLQRWCITAAVIINLFTAAIMSVFFLFLIRVVGFGPTEVGLVVAAASAGGLVGAILADRLIGWFRIGPTLVLSMAWTALGYLILGLSHGHSLATLAVAAVAAFIVMFGVPAFNVTVVSFRQLYTPDELLGRVNATARTCILGAASVGSLLGGASASVIGLRTTILVGTAGTFVAALVLLFSPVSAIRRLKPPVEPGSTSEPVSGTTSGEQTS
jgi:MFS family permease